MEAEITPAELARCLQSEKPPHLIDVRQPEEHELVALPNSTLLPLGELMGRSGEIEGWKEEEIVIYCHHGIRSWNALRLMKHLGFNQVRHLSGGIARWADEVEPGMKRY
jgi:rhodanese-related sulfurtransferase